MHLHVLSVMGNRFRALLARARGDRLFGRCERQLVHDLLHAFDGLGFSDRLVALCTALHVPAQGHDSGDRLHLDVAALDVCIQEESRVDLRRDPCVVHNRPGVARRLGSRHSRKRRQDGSDRDPADEL